MTGFKRLLIMAGLCGAILPLKGQTNDWHAVESLPPGTSISVVKRGRMDCDLVRVTDSELTCDRYIGDVTRRLFVRREQVREVRLEKPEHNRMITGAIVGAVVGGLVGLVGGAQSSDPEARAYDRIYGAPMGALVGGVIGHAIHRHGAVVYRRA